MTEDPTHETRATTPLQSSPVMETPLPSPVIEIPPPTPMPMPIPTDKYPDYDKDLAVAERYFVEYSHSDRPTSTYHRKLEAMQNKQRLFKGDRSHPDIIALDSAKLTYEGWQSDKEEALQRHTGDCSALFLGDFHEKFLTMQRKQQAHDDRHGISELEELDQHKFTYDDWQKDVQAAEQLLLEHASGVLFRQKLHAMILRQAVSEGDRSHPDVMALDNAHFSYPNWQQDHAEAMNRIVGNCSVLFLGEFQDKFHSMQQKQQAHDERENVQELQLLDHLDLSYDGCEKDKHHAEHLLLEVCPNLFQKKVVAMQVKQQLWNGDRSHPDLVALDAASFTYDGWEQDKAKAEDRITGDCSIFFLGEVQDVVEEMHKKQQLYVQRSTSTAVSVSANFAFMDQTILEKDGEDEDAVADESDTVSVTTSSSTTDSDLNVENDNDDDNNSVVSEASEPSTKHCVICLEAPPTHAYIPCGHLCACSECCNKHEQSMIQELRCPLCRDEALCVTRIFL